MVLSALPKWLGARPAGWLVAGSVFTAVAVAITLFGGSLGLDMGRGVAKMLASTGFLLTAIFAGALQSRYGIAILVGLFFSWWGDLFLISSDDTIFLMGLVAFLLGHVAYAVAFLVWGVHLPTAGLMALLVAAPVYGVFQWLNPHLGDMRLPVYAYMLVITSMVILSAGATRRNGTALMLIAALMFWVSDICVARSRFVEPGPINALIGLPLYFGGQLVFAWSIRAANRLRGIAA